jgi:hypothetical protein
VKKSVLDLIQEYAVLGQEKTLGGGRLPPEKERRWAELKDFYDTLMVQDGLAGQPVVRCTAAEIREKVPTRSRLRVHTQLEIVVISNGEYYPALVGNLSCGGALVLCGQRFEPGAALTLQLANVARGRETWPTEGVVVWCMDAGQRTSTLAFRHGIQFSRLGSEETRSLDSFVVDSLEAKLLSLRRDALDPDFVHREQLAI